MASHRGRARIVSLLAPALSLLLTVLVSSAHAQVAGANLDGVITDDTGAALPGVTLTIRNAASGATQVVTTNAEGVYRAVALPPATYEITAELQGFGPLRRQLALNIGSNQTLNLRMAVAAVQESVTVTTQAPMVEVAKSQLSSVVDSKQLSTLPVLSRNILELAQILPGSAPDNSRTAASFTTTKFGGVADQRNGFTFMVDGGALDDAIWGSTLVNVTQEAVQEFVVLRNNFDSQYGSALTSVVSVATKSGSNVPSGSAFYFGRDKALNARNAFDRGPTPQEYSQQRTGGSFGGPFKRDRTHFFGALEYNKVDTVKILALPPTNPFATQENGSWPSGVDDKMGIVKVDHRFGRNHSMFARYLYDNQYLLRERTGAESNQLSERNRTHSIVAQEHWILSSKLVNTLGVHSMYQWLALLPHSDAVTISRPSLTTGSTTNALIAMPRWQTTISDSLYYSAGKHALKFGGELSIFRGRLDSFWNDGGTFTFLTDAPFDAANQATWPFSFVIKEPAVWYVNSKMAVGYVQDDWRVASNVRLNLGLRYDIDTNFRDNAFHEALFNDPAFAGIGTFISADRKMHKGDLEPRGGFTWDMRRDGSLVVRGALGLYVTRNRQWIQMTAEDQTASTQVRIDSPQRLRLYPDINAVLGGQSIAQNLASGSAARPMNLMGDDMVLPKAFNKTVGIGWQINPVTSLDVDFVHDYAFDQFGTTDRNLPAAGPISAANPRPAARFTDVRVQENYGRNWYTALETQLRTRLSGTNMLMASYTLSRNYRDGVSFHSQQRGTQRTPDERGYNENDGRHNFSLAASTSLPWKLQASGIIKMISGSPRQVQLGFDLDGDASVLGDRPRGLPAQIGREKVDESLAIINQVRASRNLAPISIDLLKLDPYISLDMRLTRAIQLPGSQRLELFFEGFNLTNHVNYEPFTVTPNIIAADFQVRKSARIPRQAQWGARYAF